MPAPLIRVQEGTQIVASVRNELDAMLTVHGLCAHDGTPCSPLPIPAGETREARFASGGAGTYHYWASAFGAPAPFREMAGAFIVDPSGTVAEADRVMVITEWSNLTEAQLREVMNADVPDRVFVSFNPKAAFMINGLSWPATERLTYRLEERVRWRVINLTSQSHPLHLHGFYFEVDSLGDAPGATSTSKSYVSPTAIVCRAGVAVRALEGSGAPSLVIGVHDTGPCVFCSDTREAQGMVIVR